MQVSTSLTPNIVMHVFSCFEVEGTFYSSNYGLKHRFTILEEEYAEWEELLKKCTMLSCNNELFAALFHIPSYVPSDTIETVIDCYDRIKESIEEQTIQVMFDSYPEVFDNILIYAPQSAFDLHFKRLHEDKEVVLELVSKFQELLKNLWDRFYEEYWEKELKKKLQDRCDELNLMISPINIISSWEKKFAISYPYSEFNVTLVEPTTALASNLLAEAIVISYDQNDVDIYKTIIHEVGRSFLLTTELFENEHLQAIAQSNMDRLSIIIDAACVHIKKSLYKTFRLRTDEADPHNVAGLQEVISTFANVWDSSPKKDIYKALASTYNKLSPVV